MKANDSDSSLNQPSIVVSTYQRFSTVSDKSGLYMIISCCCLLDIFEFYNILNHLMGLIIVTPAYDSTAWLDPPPQTCETVGFIH